MTSFHRFQVNEITHVSCTTPKSNKKTNPQLLFCPSPFVTSFSKTSSFTHNTPSRSKYAVSRHNQVGPIVKMGILDTLKKAMSGSNESEATTSTNQQVSTPSAPAPGAEILPEYYKRVELINNMEDTIESMSDDELRDRIKIIRQDVQANRQTSNNVLNEVFAIVREASFRVLGLRHYDVQLIGGMVLHEARVAEMATGEGKTIVAALPACLNALSGDAVFVVTVNDYLARRDAELVGQVHKFLGFTVGLVQLGMESKDRRKAYSCDITYVTNSELGFDYLRDNLAMTEADIVLTRPLGFCIVDEADSILIDEARTPLIISGRVPAVTSKYSTAKRAADALVADVHYTVDEKEQSVLLTEQGYTDLEQALKVNDLFDTTNPWAAYITNALKAKEIFKKDVNYIVEHDAEANKSEVQIVDEFTGRVMKGRRWSGGLHQAVESKEGITVENETTTAAKISYQAFFKLFKKLSGMTGTAATEAKEFSDVYDLQVVAVPTALPVGRKDYSDVVFKTSAGKYRAVMREIARVAPTGRPILIGTTSVESSETLSKLLEEVEVGHDVLNAKPESALRESEIIAQAGRKFSITIATNMAGRGTDILLGGNADYFARALARRYLVSRNAELFQKLTDPSQPVLIDDESLPVDITEEALKALEDATISIENQVGRNKLSSLAFIDEIVGLAAESGPVPQDLECLEQLRDVMGSIKLELAEVVEMEREEVLELGGLYVIGTDRSESRRVDNQLRGRSGRQGDPGGSRFFLGLDDRLFRVFGGDKVTEILERFRVDEDTPIENSVVNNALDAAQRSFEAYFRDIRDQLFTYDEVLSKQRSAFYAERRRVVTGDQNFMDNRVRTDCKETMKEIIPNYVNRKDGIPDDFDKLSNKLNQFFDGVSEIDPEILMKAPKVETHVEARIDILLDEKKSQLDSSKSGLSCEVSRFLWLTQMDNSWMEHMKRLDYLKDFVVLRSYGNDDPLQVYQTEGFELFTDMLTNIRRNSVYSFFQYRGPAKDTNHQ